MAVLSILGLWFIFQKADQPGWAAIIPFYNSYVLYKITWGTGWLFLVLCIPIVGPIFSLITQYKLAKAFGKGFGYALGLIFFPFIFIPVLGLGSSVYQGVPS